MSIFTTDVGIFITLNEVHCINASLPIRVIVVGIKTETNKEQLSNALLAILEMVVEIEILVAVLHPGS